jgi:hypothetical protein
MAVDIALVPPGWVQDKARAVNLMFDGTPDGFRFDDTRVPHVSLAQFFTARASLPVLIGAVDLVLRGRRPFDLRVLTIAANGRTVAYILDRTPELLLLHDDLMNAVQEWETGGAADAFYSEGEPPRDKDIAWVRSFRTEAGYGKFIPHITLGFGAAPQPEQPFDFTAGQIGLFQLGRFCTCRQLLCDWRLR